MVKAADILLVVPDDPGNWLRQVPVDVLTAATLLRQRGHRVSVWDVRVSTSRPDAPCDIAAVITAPAERAQCYPVSLDAAISATRIVRAAWPEATVVGYGPHANHLPEDTRRVLGCDMVARGESEAAVVDAVQAMTSQGGDPLPPSLEMVHKPLPLAGSVQPAFDLVPITAYRAEACNDTGAIQRSNSGLVIAARGCPYQCAFCHLPFGNRLRRRELRDVIEEVDEYLERDVENIFFLDYVFGLDRAFYDLLAEQLGRRAVRWFGQTRPEVVLKVNPTVWKRGGCWGMWLGVESLDVASAGVRKDTTEPQIHSAITALRVAGIVPLLFVMVGLPCDTEPGTARLREWLAGFDSPFLVSPLTLRPGTRLYDQLAPKFNGGRMPSRWSEVEAVNRAYHGSLPIDTAAVVHELEGLPNHLFNLI